jgi:hypothetical protein
MASERWKSRSLRSPTLKPFAENPGNLRFTALLGKEEYGIRKPTGAGKGTEKAKLSEVGLSNVHYRSGSKGKSSHVANSA